MAACTFLSAGNARALGSRPGILFNPAVEVAAHAAVVIGCSGGCVVLDRADYDAGLKDHTWFVTAAGYAAARIGPTNIYMHRLVLPDPTGDAALSVDHINRIKTDNRRANLRLASQGLQNSNRAARGDKTPPSVALLAAGVRHLPCGVRWDVSMQRYTCGDHPLAPRDGRLTNGTRSARSSEVAKFKDCVRALVAVLEADDGYALEAEAHAERARLADEYAAIVACAHAHDPESFPLLPDEQMIAGGGGDDVDELTYARSLLQLLDGVEVHAGPGHCDAVDVRAPGGLAGTIARVKNGSVTLYDARFEAEMAAVNFEVGADGADQPRVHPSAELRRAYPGFASKLLLREFVWQHLARRGPVPPGASLQPRNGMLYDVRLENLALVPGGDKKAFRSPVSLETPTEALAALGGMRFMPRGLSVSVSGGTRVLVGKAAGLLPGGEHGADGKLTLNATRARPLPETLLHAIGLLRRSAADAGRDFDAENREYQRLLGEYVDARSAALSCS